MANKWLLRRHFRASGIAASHGLKLIRARSSVASSAGMRASIVASPDKITAVRPGWGALETVKAKGSGGTSKSAAVNQSSRASQQGKF